MFAQQPGLSIPEQDSISIVEETIGDRPYEISKVLVKARPEQVWQIITDYAGAPNIFATLKKCQVMVDHGSTKIVRYQMKPTGLMTCFEYDLEVKEQPHRMIEWKRVSGDFKDVEGYWKLEPVDCGRSTVVTYASHVNGGIFMPQVLIRRQSHIDLPQVMTALKSHSERTMNIAHSTHQTSQ
jgi:ribosome-associated toxin RatA of RatAB toxin-antitoxin module